MAACPVRRRSSVVSGSDQTVMEWLSAVSRLGDTHPVEASAADVLRQFHIVEVQEVDEPVARRYLEAAAAMLRRTSEAASGSRGPAIPPVAVPKPPPPALRLEAGGRDDRSFNSHVIAAAAAGSSAAAQVGPPQAAGPPGSTLDEIRKRLMACSFEIRVDPPEVSAASAPGPAPASAPPAPKAETFAAEEVATEVATQVSPAATAGAAALPVEAPLGAAAPWAAWRPGASPPVPQPYSGRPEGKGGSEFGKGFGSSVRGAAPSVPRLPRFTPEGGLLPRFAPPAAGDEEVSGMVGALISLLRYGGGDKRNRQFLTRLDKDGWATIHALAFETRRSPEQILRFAAGASCFEVRGGLVRFPGGASGSRVAEAAEEEETPSGEPFTIFGAVHPGPGSKGRGTSSKPAAEVPATRLSRGIGAPPPPPWRAVPRPESPPSSTQPAAVLAAGRGSLSVFDPPDDEIKVGAEAKAKTAGWTSREEFLAAVQGAVTVEELDAIEKEVNQAGSSAAAPGDPEEGPSSSTGRSNKQKKNKRAPSQKKKKQKHKRSKSEGQRSSSSSERGSRRRRRSDR